MGPKSKFLIIFLFVLYYLMMITVSGVSLASSTDDTEAGLDLEHETFDSPVPNTTRLSLTYGSLLNLNCQHNDDCILKNSICNPYSKRCECEMNSIESDNRCQTLKCKSNQDCWSHFDNTICVFGNCRCKFGLKANGKCVELDIPGIGGDGVTASRTLPDWAISLIAIGALVSGIWSGRSRFMLKFGRQILSVIILVTASLTNLNRSTRNGQTSDGQELPSSTPGTAQPILDEIIQSGLLDSVINGNEQPQSKPQPPAATASDAEIADQLLAIKQQLERRSSSSALVGK